MAEGEGEMIDDSVKHLCLSCVKEFPTCDSDKIIWGIDLDPSAKGADADIVIECDAYEEKK